MAGLTLYKASAGSGKTFRLTGEYLLILFRDPGLYRHILAVTFTNKATGEMKNRILLELNRLSRGEKSGYRTMLQERFGYDEGQVQQRAHLIITNILHDYSQFSVNTIDRFFQRVLRTFARELGLQSGYTLETDQSEILNFVIDELLLATEEDSQLRKWLVEFAQTRMKEGKSWRFHDEISNLAGELVKEDVKDLRLGGRDQISDRDKLSDYVKKLRRKQAIFEQTMKELGEKATGIIEQNGLGIEHFNNKGRGIARYFYYLRDQRKDKYQPNATVRKVLDDPDRWPAASLSKENKQLVVSLAASQLNDLLKQAIHFIEEHYREYLSITEVLKNIYVLGLLVDIQKRIEAYCRERNIFLISDAGDLLRKIIDDNEAPFIYEKTGSNYHHFMMDEFQDTSRFQWENFRPLVNNSLAQGYFNLMVGDVKQSIYRWRNGDWKILQNEVEQVFKDQTRSVALDSNWRSRRNVVAFNNTLFHYAPAILQNQYDQELREKCRDNPFEDMLLTAYRDVRQEMPLEKEGGKIFTRFFGHAHQQEAEAQDRVLGKLMEDIQQLQDQDYRPADIA
ncbi:MAG TPA: UvrD-helicase domain-containing protein, partial [Bacteroidales bacterium]|nr:UvrD-helicase domain-containing protein [Bacteroidales bacterium]